VAFFLISFNSSTNQHHIMSKKRVVAPNWSRKVYHVTSRCCNQDFYLDSAAKSRFEVLMRNYAEYCGVEVHAWCAMTNHFHLLVEIAPVDHASLSDEELLERVRKVFHGDILQGIEDEFSRARALGGEAGEQLRQRARERHLRRMGSLSEYVKAVKQCLTQWFNKLHKREGTLWESRFRSAVVGGDSEEGTASVMRAVAAYIDLNPVRAGMVADPADYAWSGYGAAVSRGCPFSRRGLGRLLGKRAAGEEPATAAQLAAYREALFEAGNEQAQEPAEGRAGIPAEIVAAVRRAGGRDLPLRECLRQRMPGLSKAAVIGDPSFIGKMLREGQLGARCGFTTAFVLHLLAPPPLSG
jgi:putative transposase